MSVPTRGETYDKLRYHVVEAQECAAMMSHLHNTEGNDKDKALAKKWLQVEELFKGMLHTLNQLAQGRMQ